MKRTRSLQHSAGFTVVELIIGMSLALVITSGVLSTFTFLGRNLARLTYLQELETESRRSLLSFSQDVRAASSVAAVGESTVPPTYDYVALVLPATTGSKAVIYFFNGHTASATSPTITVGGVNYTVTAPAKSLVRYDSSTGATITFAQDLIDLDLDVFDYNDREITAFATDYASVKKLSLSFSSQNGNNDNGTRTPIHYAASPRLALRNRGLPQ